MEATFECSPSGELGGLSLHMDELLAVKLRVPRIILPPGGPPPIATVDDMMDTVRRKSKQGSGEEVFGRGIDITHEGFTLFPMDNDVGENKTFTSLGVFVVDESSSEGGGQ